MQEAIRLRACLAVTREWHILWVAHCNTGRGPMQWLTPGGGVEYGEALEAAARRAFREGTGLEAECTGLLDACEVILSVMLGLAEALHLIHPFGGHDADRCSAMGSTGA